MIPVIALVGRPNVGKSTLFNRLTRSRDALVANYSGLTRDRKYGDGEMYDRRFMVIDTGGISGEEDGIDVGMAEQSLLAMDEADIVLFIVDCRSGHYCRGLYDRREPAHRKTAKSIWWPTKLMVWIPPRLWPIFISWVSPACSPLPRPMAVVCAR